MWKIVLIGVAGYPNTIENSDQIQVWLGNKAENHPRIVVCQ